MRSLVRGASLSIILSLVPQLHGAIITYSNRTSWQSSFAPPSDFFVDFSTFTQDSSFRTSAVDTGPFALQQLGTGSSQNLVDTAAFNLMDNNGTNYAANKVDPNTQVKMNFLIPVVAWGADFYDAIPGLIDVVLSLDDNSTVTYQPSAIDGFFGFFVNDGRAVTMITFRAAGAQGQHFGLDDVEGKFIPEPSTWALVASGLALAFLSRRKLFRR